jgi:hypothetical protein
VIQVACLLAAIALSPVLLAIVGAVFLFIAWASKGESND